MDDLRDLCDQLPADLSVPLLSQAWREVRIGWSGVRVLQLEDGPYIKLADRQTHNLQPERDRLLWLQGKLPVPRILAFARTSTHQLLALSALPGQPAHDDAFADHRAAVVTALAAGLRQIHAVDIRDCPFDLRAEVQIADAQRLAQSSKVNLHDFPARWQDRTLPDLLDHLRALRPTEQDLVLAHGDYCLPNILFDPASITLQGFVDWGHAGVADRQLDLAIAARSITYNWGEPWVAPFFDAYGAHAVDPDRHEFYLLADEFFLTV